MHLSHAAAQALMVAAQGLHRRPPGPAAKTVPPLPQPAHSPLSALLNNLMGRTADAPARPAPPTPPLMKLPLPRSPLSFCAE